MQLWHCDEHAASQAWSDDTCLEHTGKCVHLRPDRGMTLRTRSSSAKVRSTVQRILQLWGSCIKMAWGNFEEQVYANGELTSHILPGFVCAIKLEDERGPVPLQLRETKYAWNTCWLYTLYTPAALCTLCKTPIPNKKGGREGLFALTWSLLQLLGEHAL